MFVAPLVSAAVGAVVGGVASYHKSESSGQARLAVATDRIVGLRKELTELRDFHARAMTDLKRDIEHKMAEGRQMFTSALEEHKRDSARAMDAIAADVKAALAEIHTAASSLQMFTGTQNLVNNNLTKALEGQIIRVEKNTEDLIMVRAKTESLEEKADGLEERARALEDRMRHQGQRG